MPLNAIKEFILDQLCNASSKISSERGEYDLFFQRFLDVKEGAVFDKSASKDGIEIKVGHQLICCIGIDIRKNIVPANHYAKIFEMIDKLNFNRQARQLFTDVVRDNSLQYTDCCKTTTNNFSIIVCAMKDWHYYLNSKMLVGIVGANQEGWVFDTVYKCLEKEPIQTIYPKGLKKGKNDYFWLSTKRDFQNLVVKYKEEEHAREVIDKLGLSHIECSSDWNKYFFYIDLENEVILTVSPNATLVDWNHPYTGFLSDLKNDAGRTYSITGAINYSGGVPERVFNEHAFSETQLPNASINLIKGRLITRLPISFGDLVNEGINRFL
jgi:hypothetical protein